MELLVWDHRLELGVEKIDEQHRELFEKIDELLVTVGQWPLSKEKVDRFLHYIPTYVGVHFETEEKWMLAAGYPHYLAHKVAHDDFRNQLDVLMGRTFDSILVQKVCEMAIDWLTSHIYRDDMLMAVWLRSNKESAAAG
jgi:hemerythrin